MQRLKRLLGEVHRRFLWQVFAAYSLFAWVAFSVARAMTEYRSLPGWFVPFSAILLLVGLPVIIITAYIQRGVPAIGRSDPTLHVDVEIADDGEQITVVRESTGIARLFTWRNAILGGVAVFTLWAIVAAAWLLLTDGLQNEIQEPTTQEAVQTNDN
ncbi:MAG: hypothetical protein JSV86_02460 [Gemmatimonadota bacterium]|nr:MAG: hypothetical protein JSV86_02460 [Gemmatimonadota bacterium]